MGLDHLRQLRRAGKRPESVFVFIGQPRYTWETPDCVVIDRDGLDLRPLLGMGVYLIDVQDDADFALRVIDELRALQTTLRGGCVRGGAIGADEEHEIALRRFRRAMCPME